MKSNYLILANTVGCFQHPTSSTSFPFGFTPCIQVCFFPFVITNIIIIKGVPSLFFSFFFKGILPLSFTENKLMNKSMESLASSRTGRQFQRYNNKGCRQVVGCIPYRYRKTNQSHPLHRSRVEDLEVLLISSQKSPALFFPKGGWETDETMKEAALRETQEEAGVVGIVECQLGSNWTFKSKSQGTFHEGYMFPMLVTQELDVWPEKNFRQRIWMPVNEAREACVHLWMKEALDVLVNRLIHLQQKEEETPTPSCALEFFRTEEQRIGMIIAQNGEEEVVDCCLVNRLIHLRQKEEETPTTPCALEFFRTEEHGEEEVVDCCLVS